MVDWHSLLVFDLNVYLSKIYSQMPRKLQPLNNVYYVTSINVSYFLLLSLEETDLKYTRIWFK